MPVKSVHKDELCIKNVVLEMTSARLDGLFKHARGLPGFLLSKKASSCFSTASNTSSWMVRYTRVVVMLYVRSHMNSRKALKHKREDSEQQVNPKTTAPQWQRTSSVLL